MSKQWPFILWGKHPCSTEYLALGKKLYENEPLIAWARVGFDKLTKSDRRPLETCYTFWLFPGSTNRLICGLVGISTDTVERPYPLLIASQGMLEVRETRWEAITPACRPLWKQLENIAAGTDISTPRELEGRIAELDGPAGIGDDWDSYADVDSAVEAWRIDLERSTGSDVVTIALDQPGESTIRQAVVWQRRCRQLLTVHPYGAFVDEKRKRMTLFYRPLRVDDFFVLFG